MAEIGRRSRSVSGIGDVNLVLPAVLVVVGVIVATLGRIIGIGIAVGAILALLNSIVLVKRVELAVDSANAAVATISMQIGLLLTFGGIGAVTLIMLIVSVPMAVAMGITFFAAQTGEVYLFYRARNAGSGGAVTLGKDPSR